MVKQNIIVDREIILGSMSRKDLGEIISLADEGKLPCDVGGDGRTVECGTLMGKLPNLRYDGSYSNEDVNGLYWEFLVLNDLYQSGLNRLKPMGVYTGGKLGGPILLTSTIDLRAIPYSQRKKYFKAREVIEESGWKLGDARLNVNSGMDKLGNIVFWDCRDWTHPKLTAQGNEIRMAT